jgi:hypothetical protein
MLRAMSMRVSVCAVCSSFFNRWYEALSTEAKAAFQGLVSRGQIEFVNGGWVRNTTGGMGGSCAMQPLALRSLTQIARPLR